METIRDRATIGALAGVGGILTRDLYSLLAKAVGLAKFYVWNLSADIFTKFNEVKTPLGTILGLLADMAMAALIGVAFVYFLKKTGDKNPLIKGFGFGVGLWLLLFGILFHALPFTAGTAPGDAKSSLSAFIGHAIFGLSMGFYTLVLQGRFLTTPYKPRE